MTERTRVVFSQVEYRKRGISLQARRISRRRGNTMPVAVSRRRTPGHGQRVQIVFPTGSTEPGLMHDCTLGAGVRVRVNAANPGQWHVIWVDPWNEHARPLLKALI